MSPDYYNHLSDEEEFNLECEEFWEQQRLRYLEKQMRPPQSLGRVLARGLLGFLILGMLAWLVMGTV